MRIYLMRHATAEEPGSGPDSARRLLEQGRREAREAGRALKERKAAPTVVLTSPRARALETAELVAAELGGTTRVEVREVLSCGATSESFRAELQSRPESEILLVAHNPELSTFASLLAGQLISFRPSSICALDMDEVGAKLAWLRHP